MEMKDYLMRRIFGRKENAESLPVHIRWILPEDMNRVMEIEKKCFEYPWDKEDFIAYLSERNCVGLVAEEGCKIRGYIIYDFNKNKISLLNLAVAPETWRRGIGTQMINKLKSKLSEQRRKSLHVIVSDNNLGAQLFFREMEFRAQKVLRDYYPASTPDESPRDGYFMTYIHRDKLSETVNTTALTRYTQ